MIAAMPELQKAQKNGRPLPHLSLKLELQSKGTAGRKLPEKWPQFIAMAAHEVCIQAAIAAPPLPIMAEASTCPYGIDSLGVMQRDDM